MILGLLGTVFSSIFGGGMTGILGVLVQRFADYKNKQLDLQANRDAREHELAMKEMDAKLMAQEWAGRTQVAEVEATGREAVADAQAFSASFNEPQRYSEAVKASPGQGWMLVILDFIRGLVRPVLTLYLCGITTLIYFQARELLGPGAAVVTSEQALELVKLTIGTVLYLTTTCVLWWFGTRNKQKPPKQG